MIRKAKTNGHNPAEATEPEVVAARGEALPEHLVAALEAAESGPVVEGEQKVELIDASAMEGAKTTPRPGTEVLYVGRKMTGRKPPVVWYPCRRFDERTIGTHTVIEHRPFRTDLGARTLAALEIAHGRDGMEAYNVDQHFHAERVELEAVAVVTLPSGSSVVHVRYRGEWHGVFRIHKTEPAPNPDPAPGPGEAYAVHTGV